jgi:hypothetical protein
MQVRKRTKRVKQMTAMAVLMMSATWNWESGVEVALSVELLDMCAAVKNA